MTRSVYALKAKLLYVCIGVVLFFISPLGFAEESFLPADQAFVMSAEKGGQTIEWQIAPEYYLYEDRFAVKDAVTKDVVDFVFKTASEAKDDPNFGMVNVFHKMVQIEIPSSTNRLSVSYQGCAEAGLCYPPQTQEVQWYPIEQLESVGGVNSEGALFSLMSSEDANAITNLFSQTDGYWVVMTFFILGLGLAFTPCVLPMVPILAGIIAGQGENISAKKGAALSLFYVLGMSFTYSIIGILVGLFGAKMNLQMALQSPISLTVFAALFIALACSMFGFYELQLPSGLRDRLNRLSDRSEGGRYFSVAIMGMISSLVVSPCVSAPLAGALVYISTTGDAFLGGAALLVMSLGMGLPLLLVGLGGGRWLPKAGQWMLQIKAFFGVVLLGVSIGLVSRLLPDFVGSILWAILCVSYATHLYYQAEPNRMSGWDKTRRGIALIVFMYGFSLMISGLAGQGDVVKPLAFLVNTSRAETVSVKSTALFSRYHTLAQIQSAKAQAQQQNKAVVLDLYADWCASCITLEKTVFSHEEVRKFEGKAVFIQLDVTNNTAEQLAFLQNNQLFGPPSVLFYSAKGEEVGRIQGEPSLSLMLSHLKKLVL